MEVKLTIADDLISGKTLCRRVNEYTNKQIRLTSYTTIEENGNYSESNKWALNKDGDNYKFYYGSSADSATEGKYAAVTSRELGLSFSENIIAVKMGDEVYLNTNDWNYENMNFIDSVVTKLNAYWDGTLDTSSDKDSGTGNTDNTGNSGTQGSQPVSNSGYSIWYGSQELVAKEYAMLLEVVVESFGLVENTDYTIDEINKKIVLTEEGFNKFMAKV